MSMTGTRRGLLGAAVVGSVLISSAAQAGQSPHELARLARHVRALSRASGDVDYDDPIAEAEHNATAAAVIEAVIAMPATTIAGLQVKAEALAWCYGGKVELGPDPTTAERIVASMLDDLLQTDDAG